MDEDWLVLSTVHSAKGLEWDVVHLLHVTEGSFPSDMGVSTVEGLDEERRCLDPTGTQAGRFGRRGGCFTRLLSIPLG